MQISELSATKTSPAAYVDHTQVFSIHKFNLYRQPERDQAGGWRSPKKKLSLVTVSDRFERMFRLLPAMTIWGVCYYEILAENETMNAVHCLVFPKRPINSWHRNKEHTAGLLHCMS